jgi:hypothetical protein
MGCAGLKKNQLKTMDGLLPRNCNLGFEGCVLEHMTLALDLSKINMCKYLQINLIDPAEVDLELET